MASMQCSHPLQLSLSHSFSIFLRLAALDGYLHNEIIIQSLYFFGFAFVRFVVTENMPPPTFL